VQAAIEALEREQQQTAGAGKMTILTIAHRLSSIRQAKNLLFIESRNKVTWHRQGTASYEEALNRLKNVNHAYATGEEEEEEIDRLSATLQNYKSALSGGLADSEISEERRGSTKYMDL
jgi:hypothetical protein